MIARRGLLLSVLHNHSRHFLLESERVTWLMIIVLSRRWLFLIIDSANVKCNCRKYKKRIAKCRELSLITILSFTRNFA
jgi:hypothetical protein